MAESPRDPDTPRPHDALFKATFSSPEHALGLIRLLLAPLAEHVRWDSLALESSSFIAPRLHDRHGDLIFSLQLRLHERAAAQLELRVLLEHQSLGEAPLPLRVADYSLHIWRRSLRPGGRRVVLVVPIVISHDPRGWTGPQSLREMFEPDLASLPGLIRYMPEFNFDVLDLTGVDCAELRKWSLTPLATLTVWLLRSGRDRERLLGELPSWVDTFRALLQTADGAARAEQLLRYVAIVTGNLHFQEFRDTLHRLLPEVEDMTMTIAEELHQKGFNQNLEQGLERGLERGLEQGLERGLEQGLEQGLERGRHQALEKMFTLKFGPLTPTQREQLAAVTQDRLDSVIEAVLTAASPDEALAN